MLPHDLVSQRRAALLLHALPDHSRQLVLARLTAPQRDQVNALLAELSGLAIPAERDWVSLLPEEAIKPSSDPVQQADRLSPASVQFALEGQGIETIACLVGARAWSWRESYLALLPAEMRIPINNVIQARTPVTEPTLWKLLERLLGKAHLYRPVQSLPSQGQAHTPGSITRWYRRFF